MKKGLTSINQIILFVGLTLLGAIGRYILVGHNVQPFPNFEIIMIITFLSIMLLKNPIAFFVPLLSMIISDALIGNPIFVGDNMNRIVIFTYSGFALISLLNIMNRKRFKNMFSEIRLKNVGFAAGLGIGFVLIYDIWTNIGWWYLIYPHTAKSLATVFSAGIPFMIYHMISGVVTFIAIGLPIIAWISNKKLFDFSFKLKTVHKLPIILVTFILIALSFTGTALQVPQKSDIWLEKSNETSVTYVIKGDGWIVKDNVVAYEDETVFDLLKRVADRNDFKIEYTYYEEFNSILINKINNIENGKNGKYWQYYVNDDIPMIGSDNYLISNGDYVEWRFEAIPF